MIIGIGTDLIETKRVGTACEKPGFLARYFTVREQNLIAGNSERAAGNFAVKEAVAKMLGTGFRGFFPDAIEVLRDDLGRPYVVLYGRARELAEELKIDTIHVSISNTAQYASAYVIGECREE